MLLTTTAILWTLDGFDSAQTWIAWILGAATSFLLTAWLWTLAGRRTWAADQAERITRDLRGHERALQHAVAAAEQASQTKSEFLAKMSHELRTPLNAILGFSQILRNQLFGELNPKQLRHVDNIQVSGKNLLELINDILDISKVEAGRIDLEPEQIDLEAAFTSAVESVAPHADDKNIEIHTGIDADLPVLLADPNRLKQILLNLLSNAVKYTEEGGWIRIGAHFAPGSLTDGGDAIRVTVADNGIGIPIEDRRRVFEEFEQVDNTYGRQQQGTGLGLALTRRLVDLHAGSIGVTGAADGRGTTFTVDLPVAPSPDRQEPATEPSPSEGEPVVLVIEDDAPTRELLGTYLEASGYQALFATRGEEALALARAHHPIAVSLDLRLPGITGWEVLHRLRTDPATAALPVVIVSVDPGNPPRGIDLDPMDVLTKPVQRHTFITAIARVTGRQITGRSALFIGVRTPSADGALDLLADLEWEVEHREESLAGLAAARRWHPDLILLGDSDDFDDLLVRLREDPATADLPVLILGDGDGAEACIRRVAGTVCSAIGPAELRDVIAARHSPRLPAEQTPSEYQDAPCQTHS